MSGHPTMQTAAFFWGILYIASALPLGICGRARLAERACLDGAAKFGAGHYLLDKFAGMGEREAIRGIVRHRLIESIGQPGDVQEGYPHLGNVNEPKPPSGADLISKSNQ